MSEALEPFDDDLTPSDAELRNTCRRLTDEEFFAIRPIWCTRPEDLQLGITHPIYSGDIYVDCDLKLLMEISENLSDIHFSRLFDGPWWEDERFCRTLIERWGKGLGVDPPEVSFRKNSASFGDGRHRTVLASALGATRIIIRINPRVFELAKQMVDAQLVHL